MGNFMWKSRPVRAPHCAFFDAPHAMRRHFSAGAAPAPRRGYKIRPPVFYTARCLIRTLPCAASAIVRQSADGPPSPARPLPRSRPAKARQRRRRARLRRLYILFRYAGSRPKAPALGPARGLPGAQGPYPRQCFRDPDTRLPRRLPGRLPMPCQPCTVHHESGA